jgi:hypothetical protein
MPDRLAPRLLSGADRKILRFVYWYWWRLIGRPSSLLQYETGLVRGTSTFGGELLKVYMEDQLRPTPPWRYRNRVFGVDWN